MSFLNRRRARPIDSLSWTRIRNAIRPPLEARLPVRRLGRKPETRIAAGPGGRLSQAITIADLRRGEQAILEAPAPRRVYGRFSTRITSFSPDQVSSTAHTFTSTSPSGNASVRTTSSEISVGTLEAFFGQDTQIVPFGTSLCRYFSSLEESVCASVVKT